MTEVPPLVPSSDPILHRPMPEFDFENPPVDPLELAGILIRGMAQYDGVGLAANQVGLPHRAFSILLDNEEVVCFNPRLIETTDLVVEDTEGCLSFKNLFLPVKRPHTITVEYQNAFGASTRSTLSGFDARAWLHEYDHLEGITFDTLVSPLRLALAKRNQTNRRRR